MKWKFHGIPGGIKIFQVNKNFPGGIKNFPGGKKFFQVE